MEKTLLEKIDEDLPPFLCYLMARKRPRGIWAGPELIAERSGIPYRTVQRIGSKISWNGVRFDRVSAFIQACGFKIGTSVIVVNKKNAYLRWCQTKAIRPFHHIGDAHWRRFNQKSREWLKRNGG